MFHLIPIIATIVLAFILWRFIFRYIFFFKEELSAKPGEKINDLINKFNTFFVIFSLAGIMFTYLSIIIWEESLVPDQYLLNTWIGFSGVVIIGLIVKILRFRYKKYYLNTLDKFFKNNESSINDLNEKDFLYRYKNIKLIITSFLYLESLFFFCSLIYLIIFVVKDL